MRMYNSAHPGALLREFMGENLTVTQLAEHLGMSRANLSMILNERAGISALVALKLAEALPNWDAEFWLRVQNGYDLWQASQVKRAKIRPIRVSSQASSRKAA